MHFDLLFPTIVGRIHNLVSDEENKAYKDRALEIYNQNNFSPTSFGNTDHTHGTYDSASDPVFFSLLDKISGAIHEYAKHFNSNEKYKFSNSWLNFSKTGSYQEFHNHPGAIISCVYYVSVPAESSNLIFKSPRNEMTPLKKIYDYNWTNHPRSEYEVNERDLFVFRSDLEHSVPIGKNNDIRISLALNWS